MKFDTDFPADSVEFCPAPGFTNLLVCGTYKLLEQTPSKSDENSDTTRKRIGTCMLFEVNDDGTLTLIQTLIASAILDMKWSNTCLAMAESEGRINIQTIEENRRLKQRQVIQCRPTDTLCLSLDWSNKRNSTEAGSLVASFSDSTLSVFSLDETGKFEEKISWYAHGFEPWVAAWNYWDTNVIYSGGDDSKLKGWDIRQDPVQSIFINTRLEAGVTSIQCHPYIEHLLAVGSYDNTVRLYDTRDPLTPLSEVDIGGGAWRVKWHPDPLRKTDLLVACMHAGFKVVRFEALEELERETTSEIVRCFDEHESLAYGVDWSHERGKSGDETAVASCSFYDHILNTWKS